MNDRTMRIAAGAAAVFMAAGLSAAPAAAQEDLAGRVYELEQEVQLLRRQLETQMETNRAAAAAAAESADRAAEAAADAGAAADGGDAVRVKMKGPSPTIESPDGDFTMNVTGRVHWDVGFYDEAADGDRFNNGSNLRRARLGVKGKIMDDWGYNIVLDGGDSAADDVDIDTAFVSYKGLKPLSVAFGQHKAPLTLEDRTSSNDIPFIERSLSTNLFVGPAGGKRLGLSGIASGDMWWIGAGVFGEKLGVDDSDGDDEQWSYHGRLAFAPVREKEYGVHLGASGWLLPETQMIEIGEDTSDYEPGTCSFRDRPEFRVDDSRLIDAKVERAEDCYGIGAEFAMWYAPMWAAAEYTQFGGRMDDSDVDFDAYYIQAGWVLTGEGRPYSMKKAAWSGVKPANPFAADGSGAGAFELVGRYSHANLIDGDVDGGEQTNYTFGLNWWLNNWVGIKFNYIRASWNDDGAEEDIVDIFGLRAQVKW